MSSQVEAVWDICTKFGMDAKTAMDRILQRADRDHKKKSRGASIGRKLGRTLRNVSDEKCQLSVGFCYETCISWGEWFVLFDH